MSFFFFHPRGKKIKTFKRIATAGDNSLPVYFAHQLYLKSGMLFEKFFKYFTPSLTRRYGEVLKWKENSFISASVRFLQPRAWGALWGCPEPARGSPGLRRVLATVPHTYSPRPWVRRQGTTRIGINELQAGMSCVQRALCQQGTFRKYIIYLTLVK